MDDLQYKVNPIAIRSYESSFKPYYTWMTFNTEIDEHGDKIPKDVLNLIIHG